MTNSHHFAVLEWAEAQGTSDDIWAAGGYLKELTPKAAAQYLEFCARAEYAGEIRRNKSPKISHQEAVAAAFPGDTEDDYIRRAIAWAHDLPEEKKHWIKRINQSYLPKRIVDGVQAMTRKTYHVVDGRDGKPLEIHEPYFDYIVELSKNPDALLVKLSDLDSNTDQYTNGNKAFLYPIAKAYLIAVKEKVIEPGSSFRDFMDLVIWGDIANENLAKLADVINHIANTEEMNSNKFKALLASESSEYNGIAKDLKNYFDKSAAQKVSNLAQYALWKVAPGPFKRVWAKPPKKALAAATL